RQIRSNSFKSVQNFISFHPPVYVCAVGSREENKITSRFGQRGVAIVTDDRSRTTLNKMAKKARALIGFPGMKDDELMVAAHTIIGAMTGNPHFPAPSPSLEEVQDLLEDYATKLAT